MKYKQLLLNIEVERERERERVERERERDIPRKIFFIDVQKWSDF
jgi:hypothetical protein